MVLLDNIRGASLHIFKRTWENEYSLQAIDHTNVEKKKVRVLYETLQEPNLKTSNRVLMGILSYFDAAKSNMEQILVTPAIFGPVLYHGFSQMVRLIHLDNQLNGCNPLPEMDQFKNNYLLIQRGGCDFYVKVLHAQLVGAIGVLILSESPRSILMTAPSRRVGLHAGVDLITIPSFFVSSLHTFQLVNGPKVASIVVAYQDLIFPNVVLPNMITFHDSPIRIQVVKGIDRSDEDDSTFHDDVVVRAYQLKVSRQCIPNVCI
jgi:hypothetical protein